MTKHHIPPPIPPNLQNPPNRGTKRHLAAAGKAPPAQIDVDPAKNQNQNKTLVKEASILSEASDIIQENDRPSKQELDSSFHDESMVEDEEETWETATNRKDRKTKRLAAIKLRIQPNMITKYCNPILIQNELLRCKPNIQPNLIKLANLRGNTIVIATDDKDTHDILSQEWPKDAFDQGFNKIPPKDQQMVTIIIRGFHQSIAIDDFVLSEFTKQGLIEPQRIISKRTNAPTP